MTQVPLKLARLRWAVLMIAGISTGAPAIAAEYCVTCSGPDATYRCQIGSAGGETRADPRSQFLCISELARLGGHQSCSVNRVQEGDCDGPVKTVAAPGDLPEGVPVIAAPPQSAEVPKDVAEQPPAANSNETTLPKPDAPPRTVEEMAKQSAKSSGEALGKAGEAVKDGAEAAGEGVGKAGSAVGNAAKKTWNCVTSLFSDC